MIKRFSNLFHHTAPMVPPAPVEESRIAFYASRNDRGEPLLTMSDVTQAYAVYPERPELVRLSTLIKLQGLYGKNSLARGMMRKEGWLLVMPELEGSFGQTEEMLKWIIGTSYQFVLLDSRVDTLGVAGTHDAFGLYGRPQRYAWDTHDPTSLIFAYPGDHRRAVRLPSNVHSFCGY
jgi:CCR4-NOT transcriptional complex subunit CAF120